MDLYAYLFLVAQILFVNNNHYYIMGDYFNLTMLWLSSLIMVPRRSDRNASVTTAQGSGDNPVDHVLWLSLQARRVYE